MDDHDAIETPEQFLARYTAALTAVDLDALAGCYHYPSLAVGRSGCQAIDAPALVREFFGANAARYRDRGIVAVRAGRTTTSYDERGLWVGLAELENLDDDGAVVGVEHNAYQLVRAGDGWRIAVTTPLDAP